MNTPQIDGFDTLQKKCFSKRRDEWTLDDWVLGIHSIYGDRNATTSPMELWLHVTNDVSQLSEEVRKGSLEAVVSEGAKMFGRICCFVGKYLHQKEFPGSDPIQTLLRDRYGGGDFIGGKELYGKWILGKYPKCCGTCWEIVCVCSAYRPIMESRDKQPELYQRVTKGRDQNVGRVKEQLSSVNGEPSQAAKQFLSQPLDRLIDSFFAIFGGGHFDLELWKIAAHLMEEIGEVANEILYLAELKQAEGEGMDFAENMANGFARARGDERGLDEKLQTLIQGKVDQGGESTLAFYKGFIAQTMRGELADVISWLAALLWKIGEIWRLSKTQKTGEKPPFYIFWEYVDVRFTGQQHNLACAFCEGIQCKEWCRTVSLTKNATGQMNKAVSRGDVAMLTMMGLH